jgi:hypothetical protein
MKDRGSIPDKSNNGIFSIHYRVQTRSADHPASYLKRTRGSFLRKEKSGRRREADHNLHLVPRLRMRGAIPSLPHYVFMAWCLVKHRVFKLPFFF